MKYSSLCVLRIDGEEVSRNKSGHAGLCIDARALREKHPDACIEVECITDDEGNPPFGLHYSPPRSA